MQETSAALIEQLVYFDNFMMNQDTPNLDLDGQIPLDLAAFADDSFVFADEEKPDPRDLNDMDADAPGSSMREGQSNQRPTENNQTHNSQNDSSHRIDEHGVRHETESEERHNDDEFPLEFHEGPASSSIQLPGSWEHPQKADGNGSGHSEGHHLHSLLNSKIETTKRNKFQNHVSHLNSSFATNGPPNGEPSASSTQHQRPSIGHQFHDFHSFSDTTGRNGADAGGGIVSNSETRHVSQVNLLSAPESAVDLSLLDQTSEHRIPDLTNLPKYPVPPGAKSSLKKAGLSQNQIDLLSALIAQHQTSLNIEPGLRFQTRQNPPSTTNSVVPTLISHASTPSNASSVRESDPLNGLHLHRLDSRNLMSSAVESPASNYGSEHSGGSTISMSYSPHKEATSSTVSDSNSGGPDKRKRNTAASARFRVKKKMKEKEMEMKISQLGDMIQKFELRIDELEMENRFLKNLVIEKGNRESDEELRLLKSKARYFDLTGPENADNSDKQGLEDKHPKQK